MLWLPIWQDNGKGSLKDTFFSFCGLLVFKAAAAAALAAHNLGLRELRITDRNRKKEPPT